MTEFGGPEVLKLEDIPDPRPPQSGEVVVSVNAAGVNPYDTYMRSGAYGWAVMLASGLKDNYRQICANR